MSEKHPGKKHLPMIVDMGPSKDGPVNPYHNAHVIMCARCRVILWFPTLETMGVTKKQLATWETPRFDSFS